MIGRNLAVLVSAATVIVLSFLLNNRALTWWPLISPRFADLVVRNATIYTADPSLPFAEAMAVRGRRIMRVGSYASMQELIGRGTHDLDLGGKVVTPGFIDSHVHFISGGLQMAQVELHGVKSPDKFIAKVKEAVEDKHQDDWVLGGGWNNDLWGGNLPSASWINGITPNNPVWLSRMDGHMGLANSLALKMAGVTNETADPVGGMIIRTSDGEPTGVLVDSAMKLILSLIPEFSVHERRDALLRASKHALSRGVTTVVDLGRFFPGASVDNVWKDFTDVYQWADSMGKMLTRVCLFFPMQTWSRLAVLHKNGRALSEYIYLGGVKAFADGSLGSSSALFYENYVDEPDNYGLQVTDLDWLLNVTSSLDKEGLQVAIHAIGDKANDLILDLYNSVAALNGMRDRRFRIEHAQHLADRAATHFGLQGVLASVQPQHLLDDADSAAKKLGVDRASKESYLFHSLLINNAPLIFGSDWPVADINPLEAIRTAMARIPHGWEHAWIPSERISLNNAVIASTISAAYGSFTENDLGSLASGKLADFVVLSASSWDEFEHDPSTSVLATYVSGVQAYP